MFFEIFQYDFMIRAFEAGAVVALAAPLIGIFLVLRRYSLIADTLAHVSLAGIALGILVGWNPVYSAAGATAISSIGIEKLRRNGAAYGESALSLFLSGALALAVILLGIGKGMNASILNYLFGSIVTVTDADVFAIAAVGAGSVLLIFLFWKELIAVSFDEESAAVSGVPAKFTSFLLILLAALLVSAAIPVVGILLISALMVIPVMTALQFRTSFGKTAAIAEAASLFSVFAGILAGYAADVSASGAIVLVSLAIFGASLAINKNKK